MITERTFGARRRSAVARAIHANSVRTELASDSPCAGCVNSSGDCLAPKLLGQ